MPTINDLRSVSNTEFWNLARAASPTFASHTAQGTADLFTERGFAAITQSGLDTLNEYIGISMRVAFQKIDVARARNPLVDRGLVQVYSTPNGGFVQRMSIRSLKPSSPQYRGIPQYGTTDPFKFRKPETQERFFQQNFDYQSFVSLQDFQVKTVFLSENGVGQWIAGVMEALASGYTIQEYENIMACLNAAISSAEFPLQDTQNIVLPSWTGEGTADELKTFILTAKNLASAMDCVTQSSAYNALKFMTAKAASDHVMLVRPGMKNRIAVELEVGAFNPDRLTLPWEIVEVPDFGGLVAHTADSRNLELTPSYDQMGVQDETWQYTDPSTGDVVSYYGPITYEDPNENILAIVAEKGLIFENNQNPYTVTPAYSAPGLYTTYWANRPGNALVYDPLYDLVLITKPSA